MCFSKEMSGAFAGIGLFTSWWIYSKTKNAELAGAVFFFFTMELLQSIQYFFIAPNLDSPICDEIINQILTILGYLHICLQPYFCISMSSALARSPRHRDRCMIIKRLCLLGAAMLFSRFLLAYVWPGTLDGKKSTEWLRGEKLCTFKGAHHLAWSIPFADSTYVIPGISLHSFLMFAPFFALYEKRGSIIQGIFLFITGPLLAGWISPDLMEQASIWCFFSIAQIIIMLFLIRNSLKKGHESVSGKELG